MFTAPEQLTAFNKANLEAAFNLAQIALDGAGELSRLNLDTAKAVLAKAGRSASALASAKTLQELVAAQPATQPDLEKILAYSRNALQVAAEIQTAAAKVLEERFADFTARFLCEPEKFAQPAPAPDAAAEAAIASARKKAAAK